MQPQKSVTLSFDNGPDPEVTPAVLDVLHRRGVAATFFVTGQRLSRYRAPAERAAAEGHWIGNHTWSHTYPFRERGEQAFRSLGRGRCLRPVYLLWLDHVPSHPDQACLNRVRQGHHPDPLAPVAPQVFEKSLSCVHNLRLQDGRAPVRGHNIFVVDLQDGGNWDWRQGDAVDSAACPGRSRDRAAQ